MKIKLLSVFIIFAFILSIFYFYSDFYEPTYNAECGKYENRTLKIKNNEMFLTIADDDCKRRSGLSNSKQLDASHGMLFIFNEEGKHGFWMKDMNYSIDIVWLNKNKEIIGIKNNVKPSTFPTIFGEEYISSYVLELPSGFSIKNDLKVGEKINIL